jgi:hypothetical protein
MPVLGAGHPPKTGGAAMSSQSFWERIRPAALKVGVASGIVTVLSFVAGIQVIEKGILADSPHRETARFVWMAVVGLSGIIFIVSTVVAQGDQKEDLTARVEQAESKLAQEAPEPKDIWNVARLTLEKHFQGNLSQVKYIFWISVAACSIGLLFFCASLINIIGNPDAIQASIVSAASGATLNLIGGTFLVIYRSTMSQAKYYMEVLERINAIGMALNISDKIDKKAASEKDDMRKETMRFILSMYTANLKKPDIAEEK